MIPGNSQILTCPFCGGEKEILSLISGNTFGAELWSDNKRIARMMPEISFVQKCPHCGKYFIKSRQETRYAEDSHSFDTGMLTFPEWKEAFSQLSAEGFLNQKEEAYVRMMLHQAYNDFYFRSLDKKAVQEEDRELFHDNALWLIQNLITDAVMKAEFYRQIGEMEAARRTLDAVVPKNDFQEDLVSSIRERLDANDSEVFLIH